MRREQWMFFWHIISCCALSGSHNRPLLSCTSGKYKSMYSLRITGNVQHYGGHRSAKYALRNIFIASYEVVELILFLLYLPCIRMRSLGSHYGGNGTILPLCGSIDISKLWFQRTGCAKNVSQNEHPYSLIIIRLSYLHYLSLKQFYDTLWIFSSTVFQTFRLVAKWNGFMLALTGL